MRTLAALVSLGLVAAAASVEETELPRDGHPHGVRHVEEASDGHHHGDADDHHESPGTPCHHHEAQPCFGHGLDLADAAPAGVLERGIERRFTLITVCPIDPPSLHQVFHIPIA